MKIKNSKFINNDALTGGAIYITPSSIEVNGVLPELVNEIIELDEKTDGGTPLVYDQQGLS